MLLQLLLLLLLLLLLCCCRERPERKKTSECAREEGGREGGREGESMRRDRTANKEVKAKQDVATKRSKKNNRRKPRVSHRRREGGREGGKSAGGTSCWVVASSSICFFPFSSSLFSLRSCRVVDGSWHWQCDLRSVQMALKSLFWGVPFPSLSLPLFRPFCISLSLSLSRCLLA